MTDSPAAGKVPKPGPLPPADGTLHWQPDGSLFGAFYGGELIALAELSEEEANAARQADADISARADRVWIKLRPRVEELIRRIG